MGHLGEKCCVGTGTDVDQLPDDVRRTTCRLSYKQVSFPMP